MNDDKQLLIVLILFCFIPEFCYFIAFINVISLMLISTLSLGALGYIIYVQNQELCGEKNGS